MVASDLHDIRNLADQYAICMDAGDQERFATLWAPDGLLEVFEDGPSKARTSKLRPQHFHFAFEVLEAYETTLHHVTTQDAGIASGGYEAAGEVCCVAHHISRGSGGEAEDLVMHIRYIDRYRKDDGRWRFFHRKIGVLLRQRFLVEAL